MEQRNRVQNQLFAIKRQITGREQPRSAGRICKNSSFYRVPAVAHHALGERHYNPILETVGINLRTKQRPSFSQNKNNKLNRYMARTILKIRKLVNKGETSKA